MSNYQPDNKWVIRTKSFPDEMLDFARKIKNTQFALMHACDIFIYYRGKTHPIHPSISKCDRVDEFNPLIPHRFTLQDDK